MSDHIHETGIFFLLYHRVTGDLMSKIDLPFPIFRWQMEFLQRTGRVISYDKAIQMLQSSASLSQDFFVITFDDGYEDFYTNVFPLLRKLNLPAILFVTTGFIEEKIPYIFSSPPLQEVKPVSWEMLKKMHKSSIITLGAHTHTHVELTEHSEGEVIEELTRPIQLFRKQLGISVEHFAYPRAKWNVKTELLVRKFYKSAVIGKYKKVTKKNFNLYRINRIPILNI